MLDKKDSTNKKPEEAKIQVSSKQTQKIPKASQNVKPETQKINEPKTVQNTNDKASSKQRKITSSKLGLVFFQVAKPKQSLFTQDEKYPLVASIGGVMVTLISATLINFGQKIIQPDEKYRKKIILFAAANLFASIFLGGFTIYKLTDMYMKFPEQQWAKIAIQKQAYDKLSFKQKKAIFDKQLEEEQKRLKDAFLESELLKRNERAEITK